MSRNSIPYHHLIQNLGLYGYSQPKSEVLLSQGVDSVYPSLFAIKELVENSIDACRIISEITGPNRDAREKIDVSLCRISSAESSVFGSGVRCVVTDTGEVCKQYINESKSNYKMNY